MVWEEKVLQSFFGIYSKLHWNFETEEKKVDLVWQNDKIADLISIKHNEMV